MSYSFQHKRVTITGGTGSLGQALLQRLLKVDYADGGSLQSITIFSRDETKQHYMSHSNPRVKFFLGDIRDPHAVSAILKQTDILFHVAALKHVPTCEYYPDEAIATNVLGAQNIIHTINEQEIKVETVVGISTDKAGMPASIYGATKFLQEHLFVTANLHSHCRFINVRLGNLMTSRGGVLELWHQQIKEGGPVTITDPTMTRFLLTMDQAVETLMKAYQYANRGETWVRKISSASIAELVEALIRCYQQDTFHGDCINIPTTRIPIRTSERQHEYLITPEEFPRTVEEDEQHYVILPILPELFKPTTRIGLNTRVGLKGAYSSEQNLTRIPELMELLRKYQMTVKV